MKQFSILFFVMSAFVMPSQSLILTQAAYEPVIGDTSKSYVLDSSAYVSGMPTAITGSNCVWNYTNLLINANPFISVYVNTLSVNTASNYPGSTVVQQQGTVYNFFKSASTPTTQTELLGVNTSTLSLNFSNSAIIAKYPMGYGTSFTDNVSGSFTYSINGTFSGSVSTNVDGYGTLNLPGGVSFTNVLRVKSKQTINLSAGIIPVGSAKQTIYSYYHSSQKFPILSITYISYSFIGGSPSESAVISGNKNSIIVGFSELENEKLKFQFFPNPAQSEVVFRFQNPNQFSYHAAIRNAFGEIVFETDLGNEYLIENKINLTDFSKGIYLLSIFSGKDEFSHKLILE